MGQYADIILYYVAIVGPDDIVRRLLTKTPIAADNTDDEVRNPLLRTAGDRQNAFVKFLLTKTITGNQHEDVIGRAALTLAAGNEQYGVVNTLLATGRLILIANSSPFDVH